MPAAVARLMMALKLASLGQGASGIRPETLRMLEAMLAREIIPVVPAQGSVGASGDLAPLAHMAAAMIGIGEAFAGGRRLPAADALAAGGLKPVVLGAKEGLALLNGTQFSTAYALAALFEAEVLFRSALVTGAAGLIGRIDQAYGRRERSGARAEPEGAHALGVLLGEPGEQPADRGQVLPLVRLDQQGGERRARRGELPSEGMVGGAIQVPPDGLPIVFLADHPPTGGYPVIGVVASADLPVVAQLRPGDRVRFTLGGRRTRITR